MELFVLLSAIMDSFSAAFKTAQELPDGDVQTIVLPIYIKLFVITFII